MGGLLVSQYKTVLHKEKFLRAAPWRPASSHTQGGTGREGSHGLLLDNWTVTNSDAIKCTGKANKTDAATG